MAAEDQTPRLLDEWESDRLKALGFDPGIRVYSDDAREGLDLDSFRFALFSGTLIRPGIVELPPGDAGHGGRHQLPFSPELIQSSFVRIQTQVGRAYNPDWYVRGHLVGVQPRQTVHLLLEMETSSTTDTNSPEIQGYYIQVVEEPTGADPSDRLECGEGEIASRLSSKEIERSLNQPST